jgi:hypothetical protein
VSGLDRFFEAKSKTHQPARMGHPTRRRSIHSEQAQTKFELSHPLLKSGVLFRSHLILCYNRSVIRKWK